MKYIVITGANRGVGLALVKEFAKDKENVVYALCRSDFPDLEKAENIHVEYFDATDESTMEAFVAKLENEGVAVDLLINNAGVAGKDAVGAGLADLAAVTETMQVNAVSPIVFSYKMSRLLKKADNPVMIAVSSQMGTHALLDDYNAKRWAYSSSKAALSLAVSAFALDEPDIESISVHPGWVRTDMGGKNADISPEESAQGIKHIYDTIDEREPGSLYNYDGSLMDW